MTEAVTTPSKMRRTNATLVLRAIRDQGPLSRSEAARVTGLSKPTVNTIVGHLLTQGYIHETDGREAAARKPDRPGPRANRLTFHAGVGHVLGLDLGATRIAAVVADLDGRAVACEQRQSGVSPNGVSPDGRPERFLAAVDGLVDAALAAAGLARSDLWTVGVGIPGFLDGDRGTIRLAPGFAGWAGVPFGRLIADRFACPVLIENNVRLSVLAEQRRGGARAVNDAVYLHLGTGIGMGILIGGEIVQGADGIAGEIGSMIIPDTADPDDDPAPPQFGAFEWAAGGLAFARLGRRAVERGDSPALARLAAGRAREVDAAMVFAAAAEGDAAARRIVETLVGRLAAGIATVCCILNPETVILGAGLSLAGAALLDPLRRRVEALVPAPPRRFVISGLGGRATVLGAVERALRAVEENRFRLFELEERLA
jgi:predicted NBD/HSP70 family sugar kinase